MPSKARTVVGGKGGGAPITLCESGFELLVHYCIKREGAIRARIVNGMEKKEKQRGKIEVIW